MQKVLAIYLVFLAFTFTKSATNIPKGKEWWTSGKSVILKSSGFEEFLSQHKNTVVQFMSPTSADSQRMGPEWDKFAEMYMGDNKKRDDVAIALIDGWSFSSISQQYEVTHFPDILIFVDGTKHSQYQGDKTAEKMSEWLEETLSQGFLKDTNQDSEGITTNETEANTTTTTSEVVDATEEKPSEGTTEGSNKQTGDEKSTEAAQEGTESVPSTEETSQDTQKRPQLRGAQKEENDTSIEETANQGKSNDTKQEEPKREVKVVLNTTLLQGQFEVLQLQLTNVTQQLQESLNDTLKKVEDLKQLINTQKQDLVNLQAISKSHTQKLDELKQTTVSLNKADTQDSAPTHSEGHFAEVKHTLNQIKGKVFETKGIEPTESGLSKGMFLLIGGVAGGVITFVILNMQRNRHRRKLLID